MNQGTRPDPRPAGRACFLSGRGRRTGRRNSRVVGFHRCVKFRAVVVGWGLVECFASISCIEIEISSLLFFEESSSPQKTRGSGLADILD